MKYDRLYINGKIFTSDDNRPYAEAMAVKDGRICWVGSDAEAEEAQAVIANVAEVMPDEAGV